MSSKYILLILIPIFLLYSCYKSTEWEDVTADYDPVLNVIGIISLDENIESFVGVYRTTELTDTSLYFYSIDTTYEGGKWYTDGLYEPALFIDSAIVTIFTDAETETYEFEFDSNARKYKHSGFTPSEDTRYNLRIEVNGFDPVIGELTTPLIPNLDPHLIDDTLSASSTYTIKWVNNPIIAKNGLLTGELINPYIWCGGEFYSTIEFEQEEFTVFPQWCDPEKVGIGDIDNDFEISLQDECYCNEYDLETNSWISTYFSWDANIEKCVCSDDSDEALFVIGGCESVIDSLGCDSLLYEIPIEEYCPISCGLCENAEQEKIDSRNWNMLENFVTEYQFGGIGFCGDGNQDDEELLIRIMAMDDNYYQYFGREKYKEFSNFLFETGGTEGQSIGIEGGFGIFGAFASDTLTRVLSP